MSIGWSALTFTPSDSAVAALEKSWHWLLQGPISPLLFSTLGDVFFQRESGGVWWLNTGTAELSRIAESAEEFKVLLCSARHHEWFMPNLIEDLHAAGKIPIGDRCFTYVFLPIFAEGKYVVENLNCVPAAEHFKVTGEMHQELQDLPDGAKVRIVIS
jgi:hypothetical protein